MSDIFISYASQDRPKAQALAQALTQHGWSVWWDRTIPSGKRFDQVIAKALVDARCILALWSAQSVTSDWVIEEAEEGRKRHILVPVFIEDVLPPMGFRRIQAADLIDWDGAGTSPQFQRLVADIGAVLGPPTKTGVGAGAVGAIKERETPVVPVPTPPEVEPPRPERPVRPSRYLPIRKLLPWFVGVVALAGGLVAFWVFQAEPPRPVTVQVPWVVKLDIKEADAVLSKYGLRIGAVTRQPHEAKPGLVLEQKPAGGTTVERDSQVNLIVAEGPPKKSPLFTTFEVANLPQCRLSDSYCGPSMCITELRLSICGTVVCPNTACNAPPYGNSYVPGNNDAKISLGVWQGKPLDFGVRNIPQCEITGPFCGPENCSEQSQIVFCGKKVCPNIACNIPPYGNSFDPLKRKAINIPLPTK